MCSINYNFSSKKGKCNSNTKDLTNSKHFWESFFFVQPGTVTKLSILLNKNKSFECPVDANYDKENKGACGMWWDGSGSHQEHFRKSFLLCISNVFIGDVTLGWWTTLFCTIYCLPSTTDSGPAGTFWTMVPERDDVDFFPFFFFKRWFS